MYCVIYSIHTHIAYTHTFSKQPFNTILSFTKLESTDISSSSFQSNTSLISSLVLLNKLSCGRNEIIAAL